MEWLTNIAGAGASGIAGGIFGLFGGFLNRLFDWLAIKEKLKADREKYAHELKVLDIETNRDVVVAKEEANARREVAESEALGKSYEGDRATYLTASVGSDLPPWARGVIAAAMAFVDFVRGMTRPGITLYLCVLTTLLYLQIQKIIIAAGGMPITKEMAYGLIVKIIETVLFLTTMAVGWWFATRPPRPQEK
jgi:hypothetical protein